VRGPVGQKGDGKPPFSPVPMLDVRKFTDILEPDEESGFTAIVPALPGVVTEGESVEEALERARDAVRLCLEDLAAQGLDIPASDTGARLEQQS
jgi:antitoxin HicB